MYVRHQNGLRIITPVISIERTQGSPTYTNRVDAYDKLADWLIYGRKMILGDYRSDRYSYFI